MSSEREDEQQQQQREDKREFPERTLWMGDLALEWREEEIVGMFKDSVVKVSRPFDQRADRPALYAFIVFETEELARQAYDELNGQALPEPYRGRFRLNPRWVARARKRRRSSSPPARRTSGSSPRRRDPPNGGGAPRRFHRLTLWPGPRAGEVPPGVAVGKILDDFSRRWLSEPDDEAWARALEESRIVGAMVDGELRSPQDPVDESWERVMPVLSRSLEGYEMLRRSLVFLLALAVSIELPEARFRVAHECPDGSLLCDIEYKDPQRLAASVRQLVDLDVSFVARAKKTTRAKVRVGEDVRTFETSNRGLLLDSARGLRGFDFALESAAPYLKLSMRSSKPRTRSSSGIALCAGLEPVSFDVPYDPGTVEAMDAHTQRHGLDRVDAINALLAEDPDLLYQRIRVVEACFALQIDNLAVTCAGKSVVLAGLRGSACGAIAKRLALALAARGDRPREVLADPGTIRATGIYYRVDPELLRQPNRELLCVWCDPLDQPNLDDLARVSSRDIRDSRVLAASCYAGKQPAADVLARDLLLLRKPPPPCDIVFSTSLPYDLHVLKPFITPHLRNLKPEVPEYFRATQLLATLDQFEPILLENLPPTSILKSILTDHADDLL
ncbi:hypothetical protein CTAYLR_008212 [Chrysophaeum taylorii]|uniref:RRM domain-containing protein n=1 Tax=Chrysophaeum taylorii TaxID=2483200 RepID=A0AAD7U9M4_9STRA|nr:hypothetical protein CTAYLR_008212 [Chrysophaeum taylorii]